MANLKPPRRSKKDARQLNKTAQDLVRMAKEGGAEQNYFFQTTFDKYQTQLQIMEDLKERIDRSKAGLEDEGLTIEDRAILEKGLLATMCEYNKTSTASNNTVATLLKVIITFADGGKMNGGEEEDLDL